MIGKFAVSLAALASAAAALDPISVKDNRFVDSKGARFDVVGVAYQPGGSAGFNPASGIDPLSDSKACLRDAAIMQKAGVNTIRVYNLDPNVSHDECAGIFDAAGIYMVIDVNSPLPGQSLDAGAPWTTYDSSYMTRVFQVIEAFKGYPNLIGFFAGNEVINDVNSGKIDPQYIRAVTRDMKNYIKKNSPARDIAVGYSAADVRSILFDTSNYLQCNMAGDDGDMSKIDFFGLNSYSWCGDSSMTTSGYDQLVKGFTGSTVPVFFSEYGCNAVHPRPFTEVAAIYGSEMRDVFSGAIAYEWTQETNNYGLVQLASDGSAKLLQDYDNWSGQIAKVDMKALASNNGTSADVPKPMKCDASIIKTSGFSTNFTLPAVPEGVQALIDGGVKSGFKGGNSVTHPTDMKCPSTVTGSDGKAITGLEIHPIAGNTMTSLSGYHAPSPSGSKSNGTSTHTHTHTGTHTGTHAHKSTETAAGPDGCGKVVTITKTVYVPPSADHTTEAGSKPSSSTDVKKPSSTDASKPSSTADVSKPSSTADVSKPSSTAARGSAETTTPAAAVHPPSSTPSIHSANAGVSLRAISPLSILAVAAGLLLL